MKRDLLDEAQDRFTRAAFYCSEARQTLDEGERVELLAVALIDGALGLARVVDHALGERARECVVTLLQRGKAG